MSMSKPISNKGKGKNKKKPQDPVLLGFPDGSIDSEQDTDAYSTKVGGVPVWLQSDIVPPAEYMKCGVCRQPMYLLFQGYVPLPNSIYHRIIYVWACNRRLCMRKEGSFSVVRSHLADPEYLAAHRKKEEDKRKKEQLKLEQQQKAAQPFGAFQLGDLWGLNAPSFSQAASNAIAASDLDDKSTTTDTDALTSTLEKMTLDTHTPSSLQKQEEIPVLSFPGEYLWITEEDLNNYDAMGIDMERYREYIDMQNTLLEASSEEPTEEGTWSGEAYEKQQLPRGVDKQFKKFAERVQLQPNQCVRYQWGGIPLLYHQLQGNQQSIRSLGGNCSQCGSPRTFELQLMPNILSLLPTSEYASAELSDKSKNDVNSWDIGMEFGTILVFVCEKDCHPGDIEQPSYVKEHVLVQFEQD